MTAELVNPKIDPPPERLRPVLPAEPRYAAFGWLTPHIQRFSRYRDDFPARALSLTRAELHFLAMSLALMGDRAQDEDAFATLACGFDRVPRKKLLSQLAPERHSNVARLADKLAGPLWRPASYRRLAALDEEPHARKVINHSRTVMRRLLIVLSALPPPYRTRATALYVWRKRHVKELCFAIELVRRIRVDLSDRQILTSLERSRTGNIRDLVLQHYERVPFPPPPARLLKAASGATLVHLGDYSATAAAARDFENCMRNRLWKVLRGDSCLYRYVREGEARACAVVELRKVPVIGWAVNEAAGPRNEALDGAVKADILDAFAAAGIPAAPQVTSRYGGFWLE
jgi:hypothetical protein